MYLVSLLATAALLSLHGVTAANIKLNRASNELDNSLEPNVVHTAPRRRLDNFIRITQAPPPIIPHDPASRLELVCEVTGSPTPTIQWLKNGQPLPEYEEYSNEIFSPDTANMVQMTSILLPTPTENIEDTYTCVGFSGSLTKSASTRVFSEQGFTSLRKFLNAPLRPIITTYYNSVLQNMGTDLILPCQVESGTGTQLVWQDSNNVVVNFAGDERIKVLPSGELYINNLLWEDMGMYTCSVKNAYGKDSIQTFVYPVKS